MPSTPADQADSSSRSAGYDDVVPFDPFQTLLQVLAEAKSVAPALKEAQQMCIHVIERLEAITAKVETSQPQTSLQAISRLTAIAKAVLDFLKKFSGKKAAFRLVYNRKIVGQTLAFHDDIDNLLCGLDFPDDDWRPRWEGYRDAQQAAFETMSRTRMALVGDLRDAQAQTEALGLLLFEFHQVTSKYTPRELKVLNNAFGIVSQFSKNRAPTIATWFLPPYEFECDETPFAWGAFGTVHHGKHCGSDVVIKRAKISSEADRAAFVREANTWFNANRIPNVVRLFGAYHLGPDPYFVCEYAANGTLSDYLFKEENRHMTWKLLLDAALGLRGLHGLHIIHNDLKCNNILVATDGIVKLTDFGLSSQLSAQQSQSVSKPVGAYSWKAPELLAGTSVSTYESDIFAFAMCIYEAVSHTTPWAGIEDVVIRRNVKKGILPKRPEGFTDDQWAMVEAMCALNPEDRLPMDGIVEQLRRFADDEFNGVHDPSMSLRTTDDDSVEVIDANAGMVDDELKLLVNSGEFTADQSLLEILKGARALCGGMRESQDMCLHVIQRLVMVFREVSSDATESRAQVVKDGKAVALRYLQFLNTPRNQSALFRLLHNHTMIDKIVQFHEDIDTLLGDMSVAGENKELREWRHVSQELQDGQLLALKTMIKSTEFDELLEKQSRAEALALLQFEFSQLDSGRMDSELEVISIAVEKLVEAFGGSAPSLTPWFLPPHKLQVDETLSPFGNDSSVRLGKLGNSQVVVKRVTIASEAGRNAFVREADLWFSANEVPGVLQLKGAYQFGVSPYFVSQFAANETLNDFLFKDKNRESTWKLLLQAASGLQSLHQLGVLHNNLTCSHILVDSDETTKIKNFNHSSRLSGPIASGVMKVVESVQWKAPEILAKSSPPSVASDVFALGMCIIEAVSLASPWEGVTESDIRRYLRYGRLPAKHENFTDEQWELVEAMCAHDPEKRLSMNDVIARLHIFAVSSGTRRDGSEENNRFRTIFALFDGAQGSHVNLARGMMEKHMKKSCRDLRENEPLCKLLLGDVMNILDSMKTLEEIKIQSDVRTIELIEEACTRLHVFCTKHVQPRHIFYALASNRYAAQELEEIRLMVKNLFRFLRLGKPRADGDLWSELLLIQEAQLKSQLTTTHGLSETLPDRASQVESLIILRYELDVASRSRLPTPVFVGLLESAYEKITSHFASELQTTPTWFIPQYAVHWTSDAIGEGNFGVVYRGVLQMKTKSNSTAVVAVKSLRMYGLGGALSNQSFLDGVTQWHNLSHENIIELYGACHVSRKAFLVCELAESGNLLEYLGHRENQNLIWDCFIEAVAGLQYLHERNIVHGSLRCSNILVAKNGTVKLTDFGFGAVRSAIGALGGDDSSSHSSYLQWTAPECLVSDGADPTDASDVYSLGMCILEALMESPPWGEMDEMTILSEIEDGHLPECPSDDFQDAWDVVRDMCTKDPSRRLRLNRVKERLWKLNQLRYYQSNPETKTGPASIFSSQASTAPTSLSYNLLNGVYAFVVSADVTGSRDFQSGRKQVVKYRVEVQLSNGMEFSVWRRYSEFKTFRDGLAKQNSKEVESQLPPFPKGTLLGRTSASTTRTRRDMLHSFLNAAVYSRKLAFGVRLTDDVTVFNTPEPASVVL